MSIDIPRAEENNEPSPHEISVKTENTKSISAKDFPNILKDKILSELKDKENVVIDFTEVALITPEFTDIVVKGLIEEIGVYSFDKRVKFINTNAEVRKDLDEVIIGAKLKARKHL